VEVEIGIGKSGRRAYGFDDIAIVPSRRTRDPEDIDIAWELDAFHLELPLMAAAMNFDAATNRLPTSAAQTAILVPLFAIEESGAGPTTPKANAA